MTPSTRIVPFLGAVMLLGFGCTEATQPTPHAAIEVPIQEIVNGGLAVPVPGPRDLHCAETKPVRVDTTICHASEEMAMTHATSTEADAATSTPRNANGDCKNTDGEYNVSPYSPSVFLQSPKNSFAKRSPR